MIWKFEGVGMASSIMIFFISEIYFAKNRLKIQNCVVNRTEKWKKIWFLKVLELSKCCQGVLFSLIKNSPLKCKLYTSVNLTEIKSMPPFKWQMHKRFTYNSCLVTHTNSLSFSNTSDWVILTAICSRPKTLRPDTNVF